jgi:glycosyltransferase involved in cell wall biosynthesis
MDSDRRYRIAVFNYGLPRPGEKRGGVDRVAHDLANALSARGHKVTVFTYDPRPANGVYSTAPLPGERFFRTWFGQRATMGYWGNFIALGVPYRDFDVVIAHGDSLLLPLAGKPLIRVMHGSALGEAVSATSLGRAVLQIGVYVQELLTALLQRGTVGVSANTRRYNPFIRNVIPNGVDLDVFHPDPTARSARPSILCVGSLTGRKRGSWLIDQFTRSIRPAFPDAELHMVMTPGAPVEGVTFHVGVTMAELARLYRSAWVFASPSTYEGFGLPYLEALACGTPVLATPNPGSREVLEDRRYGVLATDETFSAELCRLLSDEGARNQLAVAGLERARSFDIRITAERYEELIGELTRRGAGATVAGEAASTAPRRFHV